MDHVFLREMREKRGDDAGETWARDNMICG
jgi:hypothetical protein